MSYTFKRQSEKQLLNNLNSNENARFPLTGKIKDKTMKIHSLLQAELSGMEIPDYGLRNDVFQVHNTSQSETLQIFSVAPRISRAISQFFLLKKW